jgi:hypothetical protein
VPDWTNRRGHLPRMLPTHRIRRATNAGGQVGGSDQHQEVLLGDRRDAAEQERFDPDQDGSEKHPR